MRDIAITGIGVVSPLGIGVDKFWESLETGRSGIGYIDSYMTGDFPVNYAAEIKDFNPKDFIPRKLLKVMARDIQIACAAARLAMEDSKLEKSSTPPERVGVSVGAGLINADINELGVVAGHSVDKEGRFDIRKFGEEGIRELMPLWLLKQLPNMLSSHISILFNAQGPSNSITAGCASAILSIGESMSLIERDRADVVLTGGADSKINPLSMVRFYLLKLLANGWKNPQEASRPFDRDRNGLVAGEGGGVVVLEKASHARVRGGKIYGQIIGFGSSFSNKLNREESIRGKIRAMEQALKEAGIEKDEIGLIASHGISTREDDSEEREAIQRLFGEKVKTIPIIAVKSQTGYPGAASGVLELIAAIMAMEHHAIPANPNYNEREDGDLLMHITKEPCRRDVRCAMVNAFGLGGQNGVVIVRKAVDVNTQ